MENTDYHHVNILYGVDVAEPLVQIAHHIDICTAYNS
jgi:hypothetical protein